jgi:hypothetical protein
MRRPASVFDFGMASAAMSFSDVVMVFLYPAGLRFSP